MLVSEQVKILLERMDLCPDEFITSEGYNMLGSTGHKWRHILLDGAFNPIEKFLLKRKYKQIKRKATQTAIMETIMRDENTTQPEAYQSTTSRFSQRPMFTAEQMEKVKLQIAAETLRNGTMIVKHTPVMQKGNLK